MKLSKLWWFLFLPMFASAKADESVSSTQLGREVGAQSAPAIDALGTELGEVFSFDTVQHEITIVNVSGADLQIDRIAPRYAADKVDSFVPLRLRKGAQVTFNVQIEVGSASGRFAHYFDVYSNGREDPVGGISVRGFADWIVDPSSLKIDFGNIGREVGVTRDFRLSLRPGTSLKLGAVETESERFTVKIEKGGKTVQVSSRATAPLGLFDERIILSTDSSKQERIGLHLIGQIVGQIIPDSNPVDFGPVRVGSEAERIVRLTRPDGNPMQVRIKGKEGAAVDASFSECIPTSESCKLLKLRLPPSDTRGQPRGMVFLESTGNNEVLPIRFGALVIGANTQIRNLSDEMKAAADAAPPVSSVLRSAVSPAPPPRELPLPAGNGPLLKWQAANENGVYGYEIYRATNEDGPYTRVNDKIVLLLDESATVGSIYRWRDRTASAGQAYWYYIGLVGTDGRKKQLSSPQRILAK